MKSVDTKRPFPSTEAEWDRLVAEAPGAERPGPPDDAAVFEERAVIVREGGLDAVRNGLAAKRRGERGPQKAPTKQRITIRLSAEVVREFRASGAGWQTRMDRALKEWLKEHSPLD